jgi:transcriptional regulator GlxA family with amidase domain
MTTDQTRTIGVLLYDGCMATDAVGPFDIFANAWRVRSEALPRPYRVLAVGIEAGPVRSDAGMALTADVALRDVLDELDTLILPGSDAPGREALLAHPDALPLLRRAARDCRRLASVCSGAFLLADAGLLEGRQAVTHWMFCEALRATHPGVRVTPDAIYVRDGAIWTSAGVTAGMDLSLAMVEEDLGRPTALALARMFVLFLKRPGGQSQFSGELVAQCATPGRLANLLDWMADNLAEPLTVAQLADRAGMSDRNFTRHFVEAVGVPPAKYVERLRVQRARRLLEEADARLDEVAAAAGFTDAGRMRRAFARVLGQSPKAVAAEGRG